MRAHAIVTLVVALAAATRGHTDEPPVRVVVEVREPGNGPDDALEHARARALIMAAQDLATRRAGTASREPAFGLFLDLVAVEAAGIAPGDPEVLRTTWDAGAKALALELAFAVDPAALDARWARLTARAAPPAAAIGVLVDARISSQADTQVAQAIARHLTAGKLKVVDARNVGRDAGEPERDVVARAKGSGIDVLVLGRITADYDQGGMTYSIGLDAYAVADGRGLARVHLGRRIPLAAPGEITATTRRIAAEVAAPILRGRLVRAIAMADAALAIGVDGLDAAGAKALEAALHARADVTGVVGPKLVGTRFTAVVQGSFATDALVAAIAAGPVALEVVERRTDGVELRRTP